MKLTIKDIFWIMPIIIMAIGLLEMPIGYYTISRIVVCLCSLYFCVNLYKINSDLSSNAGIWLFGMIALIYNPIFPVYLYVKLYWIIINIITAIIFYLFGRVIKK